MKITIRLVGLLLLFSFALPQDKVTVVNLEQLQQQTLKANDTLYVVNFWATWCRPCIQELPYFQKAAQHFSHSKVKILFVSMNNLKELATVEKFKAVKKIEQEVLLLNAGNPNIWIDKIENTWSGSIPATIMYKNGKKIFFKEGEFTQTEIDSTIKTKNN